MKESKNRFLAFSFGDYEGLRVYLDRQAAQGWEFAGRSGWLTGKFVPTNRTELRYDVVPAPPRRSPETLETEVETRRAAGWEPVDTVWGMDIYKSMPCQSPELFRGEKDRGRFKSIFLDWLIWSAAFFAVTAGVLLFAGRRAGVSWEQIAYRWYLSDVRTILCVVLPLLGGLAILWLGWLLLCFLRESQSHWPAKRGIMYLRGGLQVLAVSAAALLIAVVWVKEISRVWIRLALLVCFCLTPMVARLIGRENSRKRILTFGSGVFACFLAAMLLGWTVQPVSYDTAVQGSGWRTADSALPILRAEDLELDTEGQEVSAWYEEGGSALVQERHYTEIWTGGYLDAQVYTCHVPLLREVLFTDLLPADLRIDDLPAPQEQGELSRFWFRQGSSLYCVSGTADWSDGEAQQRVMEALLK